MRNEVEIKSPNLQFVVGDAAALPFSDQTVDLTVGSPPYTDRRDYGINARRGIGEWIEWMLACTKESLRVSRGPVLWVVNGSMKDACYRPAVEGLLWQAFQTGIRCEHPLIWSKNSTPNRRDWWCNGWEFIVAFKHNDDREYFWDWQAVARPQKYSKGGVFRQRGIDGQRKVGKQYVRNQLARPYDLIRATVGGGHMGHPLAHENEAPYPCSLISQIVPALCRIGGTVLDPFGGSGTTAQVCMELGRKCISLDIRRNQAELAKRRCEPDESFAASA